MVAARPARAGDRGLAGATGGRRPARLATGDRRCLAGGREKGGDQVGRTQRGRPGSRYHLAVDARGAPLEVRLAPGNENERRHLLPLVDALAARGIRPEQVWADKGPVPTGSPRRNSGTRDSGRLTARCPTPGRGSRGAGRDGLVRLVAARGAVARCLADELLEELQVVACLWMP